MLVVILHSVFQDEQQYFHEGMCKVGVCETVEECKVLIQDHFNEEFDEEYELDWECFDDIENVPVMIKEGFGDNDMSELGYVVL